MNNIQNAIDSLYFKLAIIDRQYKNSFIKGMSQDCVLNLNEIICSENVSSMDTCIDEIFRKYIDSTPGMICLYNFEILFRPEYRFDILSYMKEKSKTIKIAVIWPGDIQKGQLIYSRSGRPDYYTHKIDNYLIYKEEQ